MRPRSEDLIPLLCAACLAYIVKALMLLVVEENFKFERGRGVVGRKETSLLRRRDLPMVVYGRELGSAAVIKIAIVQCWSKKERVDSGQALEWLLAHNHVRTPG
jgi:hypothetical protein